MMNNKEIIADANIFLTVILNEPERERIIGITKRMTLVSPEILPYEIANALSALVRRNKLSAEQALRCFNVFEQIPFYPVKVDITLALALACNFRSYAYDAYYLEVSKRLNMPLLTMDKQMKQNGLELNLTILDVQQ
jgi:predicted nucleic acid-binding protein